MLCQIDPHNEVAADPDSGDDFDGEWCNEDGNLNLHGDVGCVCDIQSLLLQSDGRRCGRTKWHLITGEKC